jgi:hypothetical protein
MEKWGRGRLALLVAQHNEDEECHSEPEPFDKLRINSAKAKNLAQQVTEREILRPAASE